MILEALFGIIIAVLTALIVFIIQDKYTRRIDRLNAEQRVIQSLILESKLNKQLQKESKLVILSHDAWDNAKSLGIIMELKEELQIELFFLYTKIHNKNNLLPQTIIDMPKLGENWRIGCNRSKYNIITSL